MASGSRPSCGCEQKRVSPTLLTFPYMSDIRSHLHLLQIFSKRTGPDHANLFFLAGELAAPEQSYRTVSNVLARMSSIPTSSPFSPKFNHILSTQIVQPSDQDSWFLSGGAIQVSSEGCSFRAAFNAWLSHRQYFLPLSFRLVLCLTPSSKW